MISNFITKSFSMLLVSIASVPVYAQTPINFGQADAFETGGPMPNFVSSDDIDNDGHIDLLVSSEGNINILMGDGAGVLEKRSSITLNPHGDKAAISTATILGDFNGDGYPDMAVSATPDPKKFWYGSPALANYQYTAIFLNDGASPPHFTEASKLPYHGGNNKIVAEDFNHDGLDDLMIDGHILLSLGKGNFDESDQIIVDPSLQTQISGIHTADINNDSHTDIIYAGINLFYCGDGDGSFFVCNEITVSSNAMISDFNGDGLIDILEPEVISFKQIPYTELSGGGCGSVIGYSYSHRGGYKGNRGRIRSTRCFSSDAVTRYHMEPDTTRILVKLQNYDGTFNEIASPVFNGEIVQFEAVDMDGDKLTDVAIRLKNQPGIFVLRGLGGGQLSTLETVKGAPSVLSFEDFNEDGLADLVYVGLSDPSKPDSDAWAFVYLQSSPISVSTTPNAATTTD